MTSDEQIKSEFEEWAYTQKGTELTPGTWPWVVAARAWKASRQQRDKDVAEMVAQFLSQFSGTMDGNYRELMSMVPDRCIRAFEAKFTPKERTDV